MPWTFSSSGTPDQIITAVNTWKKANLNSLPQPEQSNANSAMDLISGYMSSCGSFSPPDSAFTLNVSASGSQNPETNRPPNPQPVISLSIG